jgi:hypothetical protein
MLYVYALLASRPRGAAGPGLVGEPVRVLDCGTVFAATGVVAMAPTPAPQSMRAHDSVVRRLAAGADAILPVRFGCVVEDRAALLRSLAGRESELRAALQLVAGQEQMTLRIYGERRPLASDAGGGPGTRYLAERRRAREVPEIAPLRRLLSRIVRAERVDSHDRPPLVASVYHLIPRGRSAEYLAALERTAPSLAGIRARASGPWPPYAFGPEAA